MTVRMVVIFVLILCSYTGIRLVSVDMDNDGAVLT